MNTNNDAPGDCSPASGGGSSLPPASARPGNGQHILYVDDESALVEIAHRTLKKQGYRVSGYVRPQEALEAFRQQPEAYDLLVSDLHMPGYSGLELVRQVLQVRPNLPVILNSGGLTPALVREALHLGVREVVDKPATMQDLCAVIHRLIGGLLNPR